MTIDQNLTFSLDDLASEIHQNARDKGFWDEDRNFGEMIALVHSELSEALEEHRDGNPDVWFTKDGKPEGTAVELVDALIRILDTLKSLDSGYGIDTIVRLKMEYNATRPRKHGKAY